MRTKHNKIAAEECMLVTIPTLWIDYIMLEHMHQHLSKLNRGFLQILISRQSTMHRSGIIYFCKLHYKGLKV